MKFTRGDKVNKAKGYKFPGTVLTGYLTLKGEIRYVVEMDEYGLQHIFNEEQLVSEIQSWKDI